jgi:hypothetical protein
MLQTEKVCHLLFDGTKRLFSMLQFEFTYFLRASHFDCELKLLKVINHVIFSILIFFCLDVEQLTQLLDFFLMFSDLGILLLLFRQNICSK